MQIGSVKLENNAILAPLAGITDLPFRLLARESGCALVCSEMISANGLFFNGKATRVLLQSRPEEQPLAVQLFGDDPRRMAEAAKVVGEGAALLDLNLGCPVRKVIRSGAGSALLREPANRRVNISFE